MARANHKKQVRSQPALPETPTPLPKLTDLHKSHLGLTKELAASYAQAACVCFDRHHRPPLDLVIKGTGGIIQRRHQWRKPNNRTKAAWANADDATRDGAYSVCIASVEVAEGLFAVGRTETRTGADYFLGQNRLATDLEKAFRLEVSGTDKDEAEAVTRLKRKKKQATEGQSDLPAIAAVVSFRDGVVLYAQAER